MESVKIEFLPSDEIVRRWADARLAVISGRVLRSADAFETFLKDAGFRHPRDGGRITAKRFTMVLRRMFPEARFGRSGGSVFHDLGFK